VSYQGGGDVSAILRPEDGVDALMIRTTRARFIASADLTAGRYGLYRWDMAASSGGASPHFHRTFSESFFVLDGAVTLFDGRSWNRAAAGDFLFVPDGGIHGFRNDGDRPASMLILFAPAPPRERYFEALAQIAADGRELRREEWVALWAANDQFPVAE
jgi:mannose-6-phosphate isomerase-like protein (cupin superfamily)